MNEYPMCEVPRIDWMSAEPASAAASGAVTCDSSSCGLRGHFTYTTICGSEMSGMASSEADRIAYALRATAPATSSHTTARHRMTARMTETIMSSASGSFLEFLLRVDEEAAKR